MRRRGGLPPPGSRRSPTGPAIAGSAAAAWRWPNGTVRANASLLLTFVESSGLRQQSTAVVVLGVSHSGKREEVAPTVGADVRHQRFVLQPGLHGDVRGQLLLEAAERVSHVGVPLHVGAAVVLVAATQDGAGGRRLRSLWVGQADVAVERCQQALRV